MSHGLHPVLEKAALTGRPVAARDRETFLRAYGDLFDHSPWVVERAWAMRPFADAKALHSAFLRVIAEASHDERLALARAHPELADKVAMGKGLTEESAKEQASAGLDRLSPADYETFHALNRAYRDKHGFPFIICVKLNDRASILAALRARAERDSAAELDEAMTQVGLISRLRLAESSWLTGNWTDRLSRSKTKRERSTRIMAGQLTTHVLDTVLGHGAGGLAVWVKRLSPNVLEIGEVELDAAGRAVLASGKTLAAGVYELTFRVGDYHRGRGLVDGEAFLEEVPVRFRVADTAAHTHVPLLISLYGYSTYRGG